MKLQRHPANPILLPDLSSDWECANVFNPSVIYHNGLFHMHYRAQGLDWISRIGYAVSEDGVHWNRLRRPVLAPHDGSDSRGVEDPRVTLLDGAFYMAYTAYGREFSGTGEPTHAGGGILPMIARSSNLITWERLGPIVRGEDNKDHVLFPRKIGGRYAALHRRWPNVWVAYSEDLLHWPEADMAPIYGPRGDDDPNSGRSPTEPPSSGWSPTEPPSSGWSPTEPSSSGRSPTEPAWDALSVGSNGVPIETAEGWLLINHGYNADHVYKFGVCLVDLDDPTKVIRRPRQAIFWPEELWELRGDVPNVVFSCANVVVDGIVYVYYGGGDHVIGLATCALAELLEYALRG